MAKLVLKKNGSGKVTSTTLSVPLSVAKKNDLLNKELEIIDKGDYLIVKVKGGNDGE